MEATWEVFDGVLKNGREVVVYYDHETTLTVVPNYAQGRTLIFNDTILNDESMSDEAIASCIVENGLLKSHTPKELFSAACKNKEASI